MFSPRKILLRCALGLLTASAVTPAFADSVVETGHSNVQVRTFEILTKDMTSIGFSTGSTTLSADAKATVNDFVAQTKKEGQVDKYIVASWSDKNLPTKGELGKGERKLADARAKVIAKALKDAGAKSVDKFSMTTQPNWIQRVFSTEGAEVKGEGRDRSASQQLYGEIGDKLRAKGGAGTVVIVAKFKHELVAH